MKANELRIGNFVWEEYGGLYEILMMSPNYVDLVKPFMLVSGRYDIETIKPIPLTEEWLLKFGLMSIKTELGFWNNGDAIYFSYGFEKSIELKYVHQLQNLYFALTGEELTTGGQE